MYMYFTRLKELIDKTLIGKRFGKNKKLKKIFFQISLTEWRQITTNEFIAQTLITFIMSVEMSKETM